MIQNLILSALLILCLQSASGQEKTLHLTDKDRSKDILTLIQSIEPYQLKGNSIFFGSNANSISFPQGALIIIDGNKTNDDISNLQVVSVAEIESITVMTKPADYAVYTSLNISGVIIVKTLRGKSK